MQTGEVRTIVFLVYPGLTALDLIGPLQVLSPANHTPDSPYRVVVAGERREPLATDTPVHITPDAALTDVPAPFGVIVPGGGAGTLRAMGNRALTEYLRATAEGATFVGSVCTGSLILAAAGLLTGREATTHWSHYRTLEQLGATYVRRRWVEDGKYITAAGVSAGIDMALHLVGRLAGERSAKQVQLGLEYQPEPPFGPIDWVLVDRQRAGDAMLAQARAIHAGNPELSARLGTRRSQTTDAVQERTPA